ncbi:MAG: glycosyltransferase, partial [Arenicellales bacterium]|nr:glycosyltransferase [Arenicellales bacterium]
MRNTLLHRLTLIPEVIRLYYWAVRLGVRNFARFFHDYRLVEQGGLLWHSQYLQEAGDRIAGHVDPIAHYLAIGTENRMDPNPLFDSRYYLSEYPGVAESGINPLVHYLDHGAREGRDPHPLFDTDYYLEHYGHLLAEGTNPLADFIEKGGYQGHHPSLAFDTTYYLEVNSDIAKANVIPVIHYLEVGITEGRYRWDSYKKYIENYLWPNWRYREAKNNISSFDYKPVFSIIMPVYNTTEKWLRKAIESVLEQIYPHWELCIADDCSKESHVRSNLEEF